jgi:hypothetical protein
VKKTLMIVSLVTTLVAYRGTVTPEEEVRTLIPVAPIPNMMSTTPIGLELVGRWPYGSCNTVVADDDYVYIGSGGVITIVDMTNPSTAVEMSRIITPGAVFGLFRSGHYLYVADKLGGLRIIDVSAPSNPIETGSFDTPMPAWSVYVAGNYAYVAGWSTHSSPPGMAVGLSIFDISDPSNPIEVGTYGPLDAADVYVSGNYAYVADTGPGIPGGLRIFDISDPSNPVEVGSYTYGDAYHVEVFENYAYVSASHDGFYIFDVSDPTNPIEVNHLYYGEWVWDVQISNGYAYLDLNEYDGYFRILDVSDPSNPAEVSSYFFDDEFPHQLCSDWESLYVYGGYAYITYTYGGVRILNVSDPSKPVKAGYCATSGSLYDVFVSGSYAYVVNDDLHILEVSDPSNPVEVGGVYTQERDAWSVYVSDDHAYVAGARGFRMFNVSDPTNPVEVDLTDVLEHAYDGGIRYHSFYVSGSYAYFLQLLHGIRILDVSDPSNPVEVGSFHTEVWPQGWPQGIHVSGDYAYVAYGGQSQIRGLRIVNVSDPSNPVEVGSFETPENPTSVFVSDGCAYLTGADSLRIIDVHDPSSPVEAGVYPSGASRELDISDSRAYVAGVYCGLQILDVSDPLHPVEVGKFNEVEPFGVFVSGDHIYLADIDHGLEILEKESTYCLHLPLILRNE